MFSSHVQTRAEACGVKTEGKNPDLPPKKINLLYPWKRTLNILLNLYMLADGDVYETKLYKLKKKKKKASESHIHDFQSQ